jgi:hypothetical protein
MNVSVLFDGSIDTASIEELILYVRYTKSTGVRDVFLSALPLVNGTADTYLDDIQNELEKHGCLNWLPTCKLISTCTDGTASTTGAKDCLI